MQEWSDRIFLISIIWLVIILSLRTIIGPRVIQGYDGLPLDDKKDVMDRQMKGLLKTLRSPLVLLGVLGILVSVILSYL